MTKDDILLRKQFSNYPYIKVTWCLFVCVYVCTEGSCYFLNRNDSLLAFHGLGSFILGENTTTLLKEITNLKKCNFLETWTQHCKVS